MTNAAAPNQRPRKRLRRHPNGPRPNGTGNAQSPRELAPSRSH